MAEFKYNFKINKSISDDDELYIYGVASNDSQDRDNEIVNLSSLKSSFKSFLSTNPILLFNHDLKGSPIGKIVPEFTGKDGTIYRSGIIGSELRIVAKISETANAIRTQISEGILKTFSIGGAAKYVKSAGKTILHFSELFEISVVTVPANKDSLFTVVKSACVGDNCPTKIKGDKFMINEEEMEIITEKVVKSIQDAQIVEKEERTVIKGLNEKISELETELDTIKSKTVKKGIVETEIGREPASIFDIVMDKYYGGN